MAMAKATGANALQVSKTIFDSFTLNLGEYLSYAYNFNFNFYADILITTLEQIVNLTTNLVIWCFCFDHLLYVILFLNPLCLIYIFWFIIHNKNKILKSLKTNFQALVKSITDEIKSDA
jgi:hypothetical protein